MMLSNFIGFKKYFKLCGFHSYFLIHLFQDQHPDEVVC